MLLPVPLLLGLLGLVAAEPAVYFKEQFLDGGNAWPRLEAAPTTRPAPQPRSALSPVITAQRANTVASGTRAAGDTSFPRPWGAWRAQRPPAAGVRVRPKIR